ncbi:MAG: phosphinothricin acetyltransferase [Planctomycetota bacterium]|jgi:phosphinothricin acetyltransferase
MTTFHHPTSEVIRDATKSDLPRINEIFNWTIVGQHVSFDTEPWSPEKRREWWEQRDPELRCLVLEGSGGQVIGVTYSSWFRPKVAYRSSVETTIVMDAEIRGRGLGKRLLAALLAGLRQQGLHRAVAMVALPNDASVALHRRAGYREVGRLSEIGTKLGRKWDTLIFECALDKAH